jgi:NADH-quinone oxidoreductase subunit E
VIETKKILMAQQLSQPLRAEIDHWLAKFPEDQRQSAVIPALLIVQQHQGWLDEASMDAVAAYLGMPRIAVYEVATFYSMFDLKPIGQYKINVCTNVSCMLCGSEHIVAHLKQQLGIGFGETTPDKKFTLKEVECLAACAGAPMLQINDTYYENLTPSKVDEILSSLE